MVSNGLDLKAGDEVLLHEDNHPSNLTAWKEKAKRFGFSVVVVPQKNPHPGAEYYVDAFTQGDHAAHEGAVVHAPHEHGGRPDARQGTGRAGARARRALRCSTARRPSACSTSTSRTSSQTSTPAARTSGRAAPASAACSTSTRPPSPGSGPRSTAPIPARSASRKTFESFGQRDEATMIALHEALDVPDEDRPRRHRAAVARADDAADGRPGEDSRHQDLDLTGGRAARRRRLVPAGHARREQAGRRALQERAGSPSPRAAAQDRPGIRVSPHFYNSPAEVDQLVASVAKYMKSGV